MRSVRRAVPSALFACLLLAGCSSVQLGTSTPSGGSSVAAGAPGQGEGKAIAVGAGPQKHYTVP